jgi:hypothetical protein
MGSSIAEIVNELCSIPRNKVLALNTETTGVDRTSDEVIQLSIVDGSYRVAFDQHFRPLMHSAWSEAETIHGISPSRVSAAAFCGIRFSPHGSVDDTTATVKALYTMLLEVGGFPLR